MAAHRNYHPLPNQLGLGLDLPLSHYELLHEKQRGVVIHWERKAAEGKRWIKIKPNDPRIPEIFRYDQGREDIFITVNEFDGWRFIRLLRSLRSLYVDLDDYTDVYGVLDACTDAQIPTPNIIVASGKGLHLYWLLESLPPKALPVWQRCQDALIRIFRSLGSDAAAKDCTRLLRVVGTRNKGEEVRAIVLDGHHWSLRQIAFEILGTEGKPRAQVRDIRVKRKTPDKAIQGSIYARWHLVFQDLLAISGHYGHHIPEGYRDKWLFLIGVALSWFTHPEGIEDEIVGLAHHHTDLEQPEIRQAMQPVLKRAQQAAEGHTIEWNGQKVDPRYRFRRQTLYDWMSDLIPPVLLPNLRAIIPNEEQKRREQARQSARNRAKEGRYATQYTLDGVTVANEEKRATARLLRAKGWTYRKIAMELGVHHRTVENWCVGD
ncbi:helix-turn-helix domain-containing protein [Candidatus Igneacidithiobacillus taiwanensis]|uniref:helix-turn-helix domain-containing protein n=2 Tax=Candidatus Igneacidithiobacillus taiwanensis TaxID=1945924 RepID=UPI00289D6343|nr:helix-turn-helix domain-containing protein [Candidatus Igneacidithiobacillus taiwanensis]